MAEEIRKILEQLLANIPGLYCILISDRDGVPIITVQNDKAPELAMKPAFLSTFGLAIDRGSKLGLGKTKTLICSYSQYQVIQMNKLPLVVTFIASDSCNTGYVLCLEEQLEPVLSSLTLVVMET